MDLPGRVLPGFAQPGAPGPFPGHQERHLEPGLASGTHQQQDTQGGEDESPVFPTVPGLTPAAAAPPPQTAWGEPARAAGSGKHGTHEGTRSTFLSWEVSSNSLASLVAELPEDKSSDYKADLGQTTKMPGERRNQPLRGRAQAEGRPLAAVSDPARGGFASTGHHPPPETRRPLSRSLSRVTSSRQAVPSCLRSSSQGLVSPLPRHLCCPSPVGLVVQPFVFRKLCH